MLDRTLAPKISPIERFDIPQPLHDELPNKIDLYTINLGDSDVMRIDFIFASGKWHQEKILAATFTNQLLKEGTANLSSKEIAEKLDYHGAWLQSSVTQHNSYITVYLLNKHLLNLLPIIEAIIKEPTFPEEELKTILNRHKEQHRINREKVEHLCLEASVGQLFGESHPYGKHASLADFDNLTRTDILDFYQKHYHSGNCKIMLTGKVTETTKKLISECFGFENWGKASTKHQISYPIVVSNQKIVKVEKPDAMQSAIRIAAPCISREHPDFHGLKVLNTLFGGYFGSRLMANIREEKGYTYGIGSSVATQQMGSYMSISTQTGSEYVEPLIEAVFEEMQKLQEIEVEAEELACVRNYLLGDFTRSFDGPFAIADAHISLLANKLSIDYYQNQIETIRQIDAAILQNLAKKYLNREQFYLAIAGK
ncbi:MAG: M16 family metallopeptidase [Bacteroidales bacterium]